MVRRGHDNEVPEPKRMLFSWAEFMAEEPETPPIFRWYHYPIPRRPLLKVTNLPYPTPTSPAATKERSAKRPQQGQTP